MNPRISLFLISAVCYGGCALHNAPFNPEVGPPEFRVWCRQALQSEGSTNQKLFEAAYNGDDRAIESYFRQALDLQLSNQMQPADEEFITWVLTTLLYRTGDHQFASLLARQSLKTKSAVAKFFPIERVLSSHPKTGALLRTAPPIDFPLERAHRRSNG